MITQSWLNWTLLFVFTVLSRIDRSIHLSTTLLAILFLATARQIFETKRRRSCCSLNHVAVQHHPTFSNALSSFSATPTAANSIVSNRMNYSFSISDKALFACRAQKWPVWSYCCSALPFVYREQNTVRFTIATISQSKRRGLCPPTQCWVLLYSLWSLASSAF